MDTRRIEPITAYASLPAPPRSPVKDQQAISPAASPAVDEKPTATQRWGWQDALYLSILTLLVVVLAWRLTPNFTGEVAGMWWDPLLNMWTLSWDTTALLHMPAHLWQAPLLYPNNLSLSYSENLLGEVIFYAPVFLATHNPVLSYNVTFYITFLLCGTNMYMAARHYTGKRLAAFVAALIFAFSPYRLGQIDHIHVVAGEWMPLAFLYLDLSFQQGRWHHWSLFALFYLLQLLSSIYYGIFLSYALLAYVLFRYTKPLLACMRRDGRLYLKHLAASSVKPLVVFAVTLAFLGVLMAPYLASLHSGLARSLSQTIAFSAFLRDFGFTAPFNWVYGTLSYNGVPLRYDSEHYLFLGWSAIVLTILGIVLAFRRHHATMRAFAWTGLVVLLFSFGPYLQYAAPHGAPLIPGPSPSGHQPQPQAFPPAIPMPWLLAYYILPGFDGLRVPARLIGVLLIMCAFLAAYAITWLQETLQAHKDARRQPGVQASLCQLALAPLGASLLQGLLVLVCCAIIVEGIPTGTPVTVAPTGDQIPPVYQWLATHGGQQALVELPISGRDGRDDAWYDYYAIFHPHPIVNGWSGYRPPLTVRIADALLDFPSPDSLAMLKHYHIEYVVLHLQRYSPGAAATLLAQMEASPGLSRVATFGSDSVWQVK